MSWQFKGPAFPWDGTIAGLIEPKEDEDILKTSVLMILFTRVGERVMLRDFGSNLETRVFDPNDAMLRTQIVSEIRDAIGRWDDRVGISSLDVFQEEHSIRIQLVFYNAKDPLRTEKSFSVVVFEDGNIQ